ncbi:conjugal transfer protein TraI [Streptosporangium sp. 'caverna']|uniref:conjugal transfer protein TraI n=1 Tax=Streptosporangium sp. 'caverna' TaxID=2202249 RepID=UPI000D7E8B28|nr:conjugal transfer protein TraI [Streptosporangium sp. 'caverna']AWS44502.1 conjugal transfer protein TraI [Streptosporangium sp. 'caverna']
MTISSIPEPEDVSALISEAEALLAANAPVEQPATTALSATVTGETKRVRQLRAEVAEAHLLADLQDDDTPLMLDSPKVRKRRRAAHEAARLHELAQDPMMRAWQASRMRKLLVGASMVSLALALSWSTAGVQVFASEGAPAWSPAWVFAWLVEPFMSLALLVVVGARAYMGTHGQPIQSKTLTRIEMLFLGLTLGMNAWRHLPGVAADFSLSTLVLHILGPVVAVAIVTALPIILAAFTTLDHGAPKAAPALSPATSRTPSPKVSRRVPPSVSPTASDQQSDRRSVTSPRGRSLGDHRTELTILIANGALPAKPSAEAIRKALGCARETAAQLRDERRTP